MTTAYGFETAAGCEEASIDTVNKHFNFTEVTHNDIYKQIQTKA